MPTWKRVLLEGEQDNLAGANLTQSAADRYHLIPENPGSLRFSNQAAFGTNAEDAACLSLNLNQGNGTANEHVFRLGQRTDLYTNSFLLGGAGAGGDQKLGVKYDLTHGNHGYFDGGKFVFDVTDAATTGFYDHGVTVLSKGTSNNRDPRLAIYRDSLTPAGSDLLGSLDFDGMVGQGAGGNRRTFARVFAEINKDDLDKGELHFELMQNGEVLNQYAANINPTMTLVPSTTSGNLTTRENKLNEVLIQGDSLRSLTNRYMSTHQFGYNSNVTQSGGGNQFQDMKGINGVQCDSSVGFPVPHDGWINGVTLSAKKVSGNNQCFLGVYIYRNGDETGSPVWASDQSFTGLSTGEGLLYCEQDLTDHSSNSAAHQVFKGDFLRIKALVKQGDGVSGNIALGAFMGAITIYHEL